MDLHTIDKDVEGVVVREEKGSILPYYVKGGLVYKMTLNHDPIIGHVEENGCAYVSGPHPYEGCCHFLGKVIPYKH